MLTLSRRSFLGASLAGLASVPLFGAEQPAESTKPEVDGGYKQPRDKAPFFYALFDGLYPETGYAALDFGDYLSLILLDTGHTTAIAGDQADWLEKALKARAGRPHVLVVNHVPAYPAYRKAEGSNGKQGTGEGNR